jgi:hypothetical protein
MMRHAWLVGLALLLLAEGSLAQSSEAERKVARDLGTQGIAAFDQGNYAEAAEKLERAYAVLKAPTLGLWLARALAHGGKLVEASERYQEVVLMPLEADATKQFREAKASAETERAAIEPRIPSITVEIEGAGQDTVVTGDGKPIKAAMLGVPLPVNPGAHQVEARAGDRQASQQVTVAEGKHETVKLSLSTRATTAAPSTGSAPRDAGTGSSQRLAGYVTLGAGGVGLVVGAVTGVIVLGKKSDLDAGGCHDNVCPPSLDDERDSYNSLRTVSTTAFVIGGVATAAGVVLLLTAPSKPRQVSLWVGAGSAGVKGAF